MKDNKLYGNYTGYVLEDEDPSRCGRVQVFIPAVHSQLQEIIENPSLLARSSSNEMELPLNWTRDQLESVKEFCPWATLAQPMTGGGAGFDYGGSSMYSGDGQVVKVSLGNFDSATITSPAFLLGKDISYREHVIRLISAENNGNLESAVGVAETMRNSGRLFGDNSGLTSAYYQPLRSSDSSGNRNYSNSNPNTEKYKLSERALNIALGGSNTTGGARHNYFVGNKGYEFLTSNYDAELGSIKTVGGEQFYSKTFEDGVYDWEPLIGSTDTSTQKPAQSFTNSADASDESSEDSGEIIPTSTLDRSSYQNFLSSLGLKNINISQIIGQGDKVRNGVKCGLPPENLWNNIIPTLQTVDQLAGQLGGVSVVSSYRSPAYNKAVGGASKSKHMQNIALDCKFGSGSDKAHDAACRLRGSGSFFGGIGWYPSFIHIDTRGNNATWGRSACDGNGQSGVNSQCDAFDTVGQRSKGEIRDISLFKELGVSETHTAFKDILQKNKEKAKLQSTPNLTDKEFRISSLDVEINQAWMDLGETLDSEKKELFDQNIFNGYSFTDSDYNKKTSNNQVNPASKMYNSAPYSNKDAGSFSVPRVGARVWCFFEAGDPDHPVVFANNPTPNSYKVINNVNSPSPDLPEEGDRDRGITRGKYVNNQRGGSFEIRNTTNKEGLKLTSYHGDSYDLNHHGISEFGINKSQLIKGDKFTTVEGNYSLHVEGDYDIIRKGNVDNKYGDPRNNYRVSEVMKCMAKPVHELTREFDLDRAEYGGNGQDQSPSQQKTGDHNSCPYCDGSVTQPVVVSDQLGVYKDAKASGGGKEQEIGDAGGRITERSVDTSECLNCGGTGLSASSREGVFSKNLRKYGGSSGDATKKEITQQQITELQKMVSKETHLLSIAKTDAEISHREDTVAFYQNYIDILTGG